jgi:MFS family permease
LTLVVAAAVLVFLKDPPAEGHSAADAGLSGYLELLRLRELWPIFPLIALTTAASVGIRGLWAGPYLVDVHGAEALLIGEITLFMALAMAAGSFLHGPLDTIFGTRKWVAMASNGIGLAALVWLAAFPVLPLGITTLVLVVIGICGGGYGILLAQGRAFLPPHLMGRGVTLLNFFSIGGTGAMQFATGAVVTAATVPGEPAVAYRWLFAFYAAPLAAALLVYLVSRDAAPERSIDAAPEPAER